MAVAQSWIAGGTNQMPVKKEFNRAYRPLVTWNQRALRRFARRNSANTVRLPGAPHYIYIQNEAEVVRSMRKFLGIPLTSS